MGGCSKRTIPMVWIIYHCLAKMFPLNELLPETRCSCGQELNSSSKVESLFWIMCCLASLSSHKILLSFALLERIYFPKKKEIQASITNWYFLFWLKIDLMIRATPRKDNLSYLLFRRNHVQNFAFLQFHFLSIFKESSLPIIHLALWFCHPPLPLLLFTICFTFFWFNCSDKLFNETISYSPLLPLGFSSYNFISMCLPVL